MVHVLMPRVDPGMQTGKIVEWLKKEGDHVNKGEPIAVVEGEKTTFEIYATEDGALTKILLPAGSDAPVGSPLALIGEQTGTTTETAPVYQMEQTQAVEGEGRLKVSPVARRLAEEHGIDLSKIRGTGPGGRIVREDVLAVLERQARSQPPALPGLRVKKTLELTGVRKTIAERLAYSARTNVPVLLTVEVFFEGVSKLVQASAENGISATGLLVKAAAKALEEHEMLNSALEGDEIRIFDDINIAVAIDSPLGLVAPVVRNANGLSTREISDIIEQYKQKAANGQLSIEELTGGTFTVTNLGTHNVDLFAPVINPPHCAILGIGKATERAAVVDGKVTPKIIAILSLVFDHRIVDGAPAARFLSRVKELIENPTSVH